MGAVTRGVTLVCQQRHREYFPVQGSAKKPYIVKMFQDNALPECNCVGFMTKRNKNANLIGGGFAGAGTGLAKQTAAWCKHLEEVKQKTCAWEGKPNEKQVQCPQCGGPVVQKTAARAPGHGVIGVTQAYSPPAKPRKVTKKAALPDPSALIKMAQELAGVEPTAPKPATREQARKTFESITGKVTTNKDVSADEAAAVLASMLKEA